MTTYRSGSLIGLVSESALLCFGDIFIPLCAPRVYSRGSNLALSSVCSAGQTFTPLGEKIDKFRILAGCKFAYRKADAQRERSEKQTAAQVPGKRNRIDFSASGERNICNLRRAVYRYTTAVDLSLLRETGNCVALTLIPFSSLVSSRIYPATTRVQSLSKFDDLLPHYRSLLPPHGTCHVRYSSDYTVVHLYNMAQCHSLPDSTLG